MHRSKAFWAIALVIVAAGLVTGRNARYAGIGGAPRTPTLSGSSADFGLVGGPGLVRDGPKREAPVVRSGGVLYRPVTERNDLGDELLATITLRYGAVLQSAEIPSAAVELLTRLLAERELIARDVLNLSREAGIDVVSNKETVERLLATARRDTDASIRALAGDTGFNDLVRCDDDLRVQAIVAELQEQLGRTHTPLREDRAEELSRILLSTAPCRPDGTFDLGLITTAAVSRSWGILDQPQVAALEQLQRRQTRRR